MNRKRMAGISIGVVVVGLMVGTYFFLNKRISGGSMLEDSFRHTGPLPPLGDVLLDQSVHHDAYIGWIELYVDRNIHYRTIGAAVTKAGGTVIAQRPRLGQYTIQVAAGNEDAFCRAIKMGSCHVVVPIVRGAE